MEAIEGPVGDRQDQDADGWEESRHRPDFLWNDLSERLAVALSEIAVSDVCREAARRSVERDLPDGLDYQI